MNESDRQELMELIEFLQQGAKHPFISTVVTMPDYQVSALVVGGGLQAERRLAKR